MDKAIKLFVILLPILCIASCKSRYDILLASNNVDEKYEAAFDYFDGKKYKKAASLFESLSMLTGGTSRDDTVRYYWALSNYRNADYITAEANFNSFVSLYPRSPFTSTARFLRLDCLYRATYRYELDQNPTNIAIMGISEYMMEFPESDKLDICQEMLTELNERLDTKEYANAYLYYRMEDYIAAKTALKNILKDNSDNIHREKVLYYIAKSTYKYADLSIASKQKERFMEFLDDYYNFAGEYPESEYMADLSKLFERAQFKLGRDDQVTLSKEQLREQKKKDKALDKELKSSDKKVDRQLAK